MSLYVNIRCPTKGLISDPEAGIFLCVLCKSYKLPIFQLAHLKKSQT